jgi:AraC family transcriptional regulator, activator of mtrCDE
MSPKQTARTRGPRLVANRPKSRVAIPDINRLISGLEVSFVNLTECVVSPGWGLSFPPNASTGMHYNLAGTGRLIAGSFPAISLIPHTLVVLPPMTPFRIEAGERSGPPNRQVKVGGSSPTELTRYVAGKGDPEILLICGFIRTAYGTSLDILGNLSSPLVEQFTEGDRLDQKLKAAVSELITQEIGSGAMTASLIKQVLISIFRRSFASSASWLDGFPLLQDPQIARVFARMVGEPEASHTVETLARVAGLSRSSFMQRFAGAVGSPPLVALRQLRMKKAAGMLEANVRSIEQIAGAVGYKNRSGFSRAFRAIYGVDPMEYRRAKVEQHEAGH